MPQSLITAVGPIGMRVRDCTESWSPTLEYLPCFLRTGSLDVCVQRSCVHRGRPGVFAILAITVSACKAHVELPAMPPQSMQDNSVAVLAQDFLAPFPRFVPRLVQRSHRLLFAVEKLC